MDKRIITEEQDTARKKLELSWKDVIVFRILGQLCELIREDASATHEVFASYW
jgi:hypothetical protein